MRGAVAWSVGQDPRVRVGTRVCNAGTWLELVCGHGDTRVQCRDVAGVWDREGTRMCNAGIYLEHTRVYGDMCAHCRMCLEYVFMCACGATRVQCRDTPAARVCARRDTCVHGRDTPAAHVCVWGHVCMAGT